MKNVTINDKQAKSLSEIVGEGYRDFWNSKKRYLVLKGSRRSKKSTTTALRWFWLLNKYPQANLLVVRKTYRTLKDSCFAQLRWACNQLNFGYMWDFKANPMEAVNKITNQKILFRGMDDPLKITSITVEKGVLNFLWIEEAYELMSEEDFNRLEESIIGSTPEGYFKQIVLTFNPWNDRHWLKARFFDVQDDDVLTKTTTYKCNEWISTEDREWFEKLKESNPKRYSVVGLGNWGIVDGLVYENWKEKSFQLSDIRHCKTVAGMDYGYTNDETALFIGFLDEKNKVLYVWDEMYKKGLINREIYNEIVKMGYQKELITADSAEPKSNAELNNMGLRITPARKGKDSINNGIQWIQDLKIIIHPRCVNFITEISNYAWSEDKFGKKLNVPIDANNHLMDAMRYALEKYIIGSGWQVSTNKLM